MKLLLLLACGLLCHGRENVIFEQIGEMAGSTSYLHAHITINLTAIHHQIAEYRKALLTHFENRETVSKFINDSLPANQSNPYVMEYAAHQWTIIARLHERDLIDIEEHALSPKKHSSRRSGKSGCPEPHSASFYQTTAKSPKP
jgi:hypothetical protein